jgi:hypothetical protein
VKSAALFSKLSLIPYLVVAGMSGCGDTGESNPNSNAQPFAPVCFGQQGQPCQCPTGTGFQLCQPDGQWGVCTCGGQPQGTGGFGNVPNQPPGGQNPGTGVCGDGQITAPEQCDGQNQGGQTCATVSMGACTGGYLICTGQCIFDYSACQCNGAGGQSGAGGSGGTFGTGGTTGIGGNVPVGGTTGQP